MPIKTEFATTARQLKKNNPSYTEFSQGIRKKTRNRPSGNGCFNDNRGNVDNICEMPFQKIPERHFLFKYIVPLF